MGDEAENIHLLPTREAKLATQARLIRERAERERAAAEERGDGLPIAEVPKSPPSLKLVSSADGTKTAVIRNARSEKRKPAAQDQTEALPKFKIELGPKDSAYVGKAAHDAMIALVELKAPIYQRAGALVQPIVSPAFNAEAGRTKVVSLVEMNTVALKAVLMRQLTFVRKQTDSGPRPVNPGFEIPHLILKDREVWPFPEIAGLINAPTLRPDGSLLRVEGYDDATGMLLMNSPPMPPIDPKPSRADAEAALLTLKELLAEFPFVDEGGRAVALSLIISTLVRGALDKVPLHVITAPAAGSGKSYILDVASMVATGETAAVVAATGSVDELEKRIGAELIAGRVLISLDNINGVLSSELLCQAVTQDSISLRPLGSSNLERVANRSVFSANGININPADDLTRRTLLARLDAGVEKPWERPFRQDPVRMVAADRGRYVAAALTIPLAFIAAGEPTIPGAVNGFGRWCRFVRGPLVWLGEADPISTMGAARDGDPKLQTRAAVLGTMAALFGQGKDSGRTAAQLIESVASTAEALLDAKPAQAADRKALREALMSAAGVGKEINAQKLGYWLRQSKGQIVGGLRLCGEPDRRSVTRWWVERADVE